jgi:hypothetical protein
MTSQREQMTLSMIEKEKKRTDMSALECCFAALDRRVASARKEAEGKVTSAEQAEYVKHHQSEIEHGLEFPIKGMKEILQSDPEYAILCNSIGICYFEAEAYSKAEKWFVNTIDAIPEDYTYPEPYRYLEKIRERRKASHLF